MYFILCLLSMVVDQVIPMSAPINVLLLMIDTKTSVKTNAQMINQNKCINDKPKQMHK